MHFDENQLSPSLISLSLLSTTHPRSFQQSLVRTSTRFYSCFILVMDSSLGFGSTTCNINALLTLAFALASLQKSLTNCIRLLAGSLNKRYKVTHSSLRKHSATLACRRTISDSISLPLSGFFSPFPHGTCSLSVTCLYLALAGGPAWFLQGFTCPVILGK